MSPKVMRQGGELECGAKEEVSDEKILRGLFPVSSDHQMYSSKLQIEFLKITSVFVQIETCHICWMI